MDDKRGAVNENTGASHPHSIAIRAQLKVIEKSVARLMKERESIIQIKASLAKASELFTKEKKNLHQIDKYLDSSIICNKMTMEEFKGFYTKYFKMGDFTEIKEEVEQTSDLGLD